MEEDEIRRGEDDLLRAIDRTELCDQLKTIRSIYAELAEKQKKFCGDFGLYCVKGCGSCCAHFMPDITAVEAEFLAFGLITEHLEEQVLCQLESGRNEPERCPFFREEGEYHCTVYRWRPLICRLFGASAYEDKEGHPVFRRCRWNPEEPEPTREQLEAHGDILITMSEYGLLVDECDAANTERESLWTALPRAIRKIGLMMELESGELPDGA